MKKNIKGFTLIELLAVIVIIAIISGLVVISVKKILDGGKESLYKNYEEALESATRNYLVDKNYEIPNANNLIYIFANDLINNNYIDELIDSNGASCHFSYTKVTRLDDVSGNKNIKIESCVICKIDDKYYYKTDGCLDIDTNSYLQVNSINAMTTLNVHIKTRVKITLNDTSINGTYGYIFDRNSNNILGNIEFNNGISQFYLNDNESGKLVSIPYGTNYHIDIRKYNFTSSNSNIVFDTYAFLGDFDGTISSVSSTYDFELITRSNGTIPTPPPFG